MSLPFYSSPLRERATKLRFLLENVSKVGEGESEVPQHPLTQRSLSAKALRLRNPLPQGEGGVDRLHYPFKYLIGA
jgi:hypothetical protein